MRFTREYFSSYRKVGFGVRGLRTSFGPIGTKRLTAIWGNFGQISIILFNQLSNTNLLVVFLAVIGKCENQLLGHKLCILAVADCVYLILKVSDVTPRQWGYFGQSYDLRFKNGKNEVIEISY